MWVTASRCDFDYVFVKGGCGGEGRGKVAIWSFVRGDRCLVVVRVLRLMLVPDLRWRSVIRQLAFSCKGEVGSAYMLNDWISSTYTLYSTTATSSSSRKVCSRSEG